MSNEMKFPPMRISVDYDDDVTYSGILTCYYKMAKLTIYPPMIWETRNGFHLTGWLKDPITEDKLYCLREHLGDDPRRVEGDRCRARHGEEARDILFTTRQGGPSRRPVKLEDLHGCFFASGRHDSPAKRAALDEWHAAALEAAPPPYVCTDPECPCHEA